MSSSSPRAFDLQQQLQSMLQKVLGAPDRLDGNPRWSLKPAPFKPSINIVISSDSDHPEVWVFDPNAKDDAVKRITIDQIEQALEVISMVKQRLEQAQRAN